MQSHDINYHEVLIIIKLVLQFIKVARVKFVNKPLHSPGDFETNYCLFGYCGLFEMNNGYFELFLNTISG